MVSGWWLSGGRKGEREREGESWRGSLDGGRAGREGRGSFPKVWYIITWITVGDGSIILLEVRVFIGMNITKKGKEMNRSYDIIIMVQKSQWYDNYSIRSL